MNIFKQFVKSLYSPETIAKFRHQKIGKTIFYVFFFMLIASIPISIQLGSSVISFFQQAEKHLAEDLPDFTVDNGILHSEAAEPIHLTSQDYLLIFDASGELTPDEIDDQGTVIALLEREVLIQKDSVRRSFGYQEFNFDLSSAAAGEFLQTISGSLPLIIGILIVFLYLFLTGAKFVGIFALSLIGLIMNKNKALRYRHSWTLAAYSATLPTILLTLFDALRITVPFTFSIYWIIAIVILHLAFREIPNRNVEK
ncbi:Protein of unknown function [Evansella caseinilytica]|uniref:DUF1189 domain-containing protein n=1 Tax=Evansella caseinilytica TaxID=1503961 RepID=A0A1H3KPF5_9BACI|nr:DUF1189 domain-containing protein [Evansella caseinilytica]SDY53605.1 Protein of unknown function [Evansella caseinilytica]